MSDKKNDIQLSTDINVITAEIQSYKQIAGQSIFEIGRRLKHVKENDLVHGEFGKWLDSIEMNWDTANRFMKIATELNSDTYRNIGWQAMYLIATLPEEEREKEHVTSKGEVKTVDEMTVRELQEVKRQLRETEQTKQQAEQQAKQARQSEKIALDKLEKEQSKPPKVIEKEVIKEVDNTDYEQVNILKKQLHDKENELIFLNNELNKIKEDTKEYHQLKENLQQLYRDKREVEEQIEAATSISGLVVDVEYFIQEKIGGIKYSKAVRERIDSLVVRENIKQIGELLTKAGQDVFELLPENRKKNIIDMKVVE